MITYCSGAKGDTRRYRTFHPYEQLHLAGLPVQLSYLTDRQLKEKIADSKLVVFHRVAMDKFTQNLFDQIKMQKILVFMDIDDLIFEPQAIQWIDSPDFNIPIRYSLYQKEMSRQRIALEACQAAITSTQYLAQKIITIGKPAIVHRNAFSMEMYEISQSAFLRKKTNPKQIFLGYASGTPTHDRDFALIKPALKQVMTKYTNSWLLTIGHLNIGKDWGNLSDRIIHQEWIPWRKLPYLLAQIDINLAPLITDNPFGQSKSEIKYMEAALLRLPTIASPSDAFQYAIRTGENGILAENLDEWIQAMILLITDKEIRQAMGFQAYEDVVAKNHPKVRSLELIEAINQLSQMVEYGNDITLEFLNPQHNNYFSKKQNYTYESILDIEKKPTWVERSVYSLRYRGLSTLIKQIWVMIRRWIHPIIPLR